MGQNEDDVELLHADPGKLLVRLQDIFAAVAWVYKRGGFLHASEVDEIIQNMNLQFLTNIETIRKSYDPTKAGAATLRAYVRSLARNVCRKHYRDHPDYTPLSFCDPRVTIHPDSVTDPIAIAQTIEVFHAAIETAGDRKTKLLLFLKLCYHIPIQMRDVTDAYPEAGEALKRELIGLFGEDFETKGEMEVFEAARPILNQLEQSNTSAESYTRWITREIIDLCEIMNGEPPVSSFDKHSLRILVDDLFEPFLQKTFEPRSPDASNVNLRQKSDVRTRKEMTS